MTKSPIQIVLNSKDFIEAWQRPPGGSKKDFYEGNDAAFVMHKQAVWDQLDKIKDDITGDEITFAKVILKQSALAKSHRPTKALFNRDVAPVIGAGDLGELFVEIQPSTIEIIKSKIAKAEETTKYKTDKNGKKSANPSATRSELGAIEEIKPYAVSDKRKFSVSEGLEWLSNPQTGGSYIVDLFEIIPPRQEWDNLSPQKFRLFRSFGDGLSKFGAGMTASRLSGSDTNASMLGVRLEDSSEGPTIQLLPIQSSAKRQNTVKKVSQNVDRHSELIHFLDNHPLVKKITLPPIITRSSHTVSKPHLGSKHTLPKVISQKTYPKIAIVDGGVSEILGDWVEDKWGLISKADKDEAHGTFIGGLVLSGHTLNGADVCNEVDGCKIIDLDILPIESSFANYYTKPLEFFKELEIAVKELNARTGVRVFNFSLNIEEHVSSSGYSIVAKTLDRIAEENDVVFIISAGNTHPNDTRKEWPKDPSDALSILAASRNDTIKIPAESCRNLSISAINPPNMKGIVPFAPSNYTCRGPGIRVGLKPDLTHVGGCGTKSRDRGHGLFSLDVNGNITDGCGTSYSAPNVAKTVACIDHSINGSLSRESLMALAVHHAEVPEILKDKQLQGIAKYLVGFGKPISSEDILNGSDNSITLVFANRINLGHKLSFNFAWPNSLVKNGKCFGNAKLTLVSTPPFDYSYGAEFARINIEGHLRQEDKKGRYIGRLSPVYTPDKGDNQLYEKNQIENSFKWSSTKIFEKTFKGVGESINWKLEVDYLARDGQAFPSIGVPFTAILTISDPAGKEPVFKDMHQSLQALGVKIVDIKTAARILARS